MLLLLLCCWKQLELFFCLPVASTIVPSSGIKSLALSVTTAAQCMAGELAGWKKAASNSLVEKRKAEVVVLTYSNGSNKFSWTCFKLIVRKRSAFVAVLVFFCHSSFFRG